MFNKTSAPFMDRKCAVWWMHEKLYSLCHKNIVYNTLNFALFVFNVSVELKLHKYLCVYTKNPATIHKIDKLFCYEWTILSFSVLWKCYPFLLCICVLVCDEHDSMTARPINIFVCNFHYHFVYLNFNGFPRNYKIDV